MFHTLKITIIILVQVVDICRSWKDISVFIVLFSNLLGNQINPLRSLLLPSEKGDVATEARIFLWFSVFSYWCCQSPNKLLVITIISLQFTLVQASVAESSLIMWILQFEFPGLGTTIAFSFPCIHLPCELIRQVLKYKLVAV